MSKFRDFINKILYRNTGQEVMNILINCEAYQINKNTNESLNNKIQENLLQLEKNIKNEISDSSSKGKFMTIIHYNSKDYYEQGIKYLKQTYKEKGYKVRICWSRAYYGCNRKIIISWKHWNKKQLI